jgi:Abnormal spindle-like microcephaly-assoc'd, ASPM-SPD-2-Hydin
MRRLTPAAAGLAGALILAAPGCRTHGIGITNASCLAELTAGEGAAAVTPGATADSLDLDFGPLLLGQQLDQVILISNVGEASLQVLSLEPPVASAGFEVGLSSPDPLQPGSAPLIVAVRFRPMASGPTSAQVVLATDCPGGNLTLNLTGDGFRPLLEVDPPALEFGRVLLGSSEQRDVRVTNDSDTARALTFFPIQGADSALFRMQTAPPAMLAPHEQTTLSVVFTPTEAVRLPTRSAIALALDCTGCEAEVGLTGQGVLTGLSVTPNPLDFGALEPPYSASAAVVLENVANAPIALLAAPSLVQPSPNAFQLGPAAPAAGTILAPGAKVQVPMVFTALGIGRYQATLMLTTNDPLQGNVAVPVSGISGGPRIQCTPEAVDFGDVGVGISAGARVICTNVGIGNDADPSTNLYLSLATDSPDFSAAFDTPLPSAGLWPGPLSRAVIDLSFRPASPLAEQGQLIITSNDPTAPELLIPVQGTGVALPPCVSSVQPALLDFGQVARGLTRDAAFVIADTGTVDCLVNGLDLSADTSAAFSLPDGPVISQRLSPAGNSSGAPSELSVTVRFTPPLDHATRYTPGSDSGNFAGQVQFALSDPKAPQQSVSLVGRSPDDCLVFDPVTPDLGAVPYDPSHQRWCSASRTLTVTNVCDRDASLDSAYFDGGVGTFSITGPGGATGPWTISPLLGGAAPVSFQLAFRPASAGEGVASLEFQSSQLFPNQALPKTECGYRTIEIASQVHGREVGSGIGSADGEQVDQFTGRGTQVDLLWIVDVMDAAGWQIAASDLAPFLSYPSANGIDFQMAVTSTSAVGAAPAVDVTQDFGYLEPCDHCWNQGSTATIVVPGSSPDPASVLAPLLSIGGIPAFQVIWDVDCPAFDDQFFESFTEALQPDLLAAHNAGFLRPNSVLAVVGLGDDDNDESVGSFSFFYNFLAGIKGRDRVSFSFAGNPSSDQFNSRVDHLPGLLVELTGGVNVDSSQPGWMDQLAQVWTRIADQLFRYPLSSLPADPNPYDAVAHPGGLQVRVAGQAVLDSSWHYDPVGNAVIFEPSGAPTAGAALTVGYALGCGG